MKIEVYNAVGGAAFFQAMLREWRAAGHSVVCHEAVSEQEYRARRGRIGRLALRWRMYAGQAWRCWRESRRARGRAEVRVVVTNPFFAPSLVAWAGAGRVPVINLLYDLYPEALVQAGQIKAGSWLARRCAAITRYGLRQSAATVFLGEYLRDCTEAAHGPARRSVVIPVGADGRPFCDHAPAPRRADEPLQILYSGQLGRMHDVNTLADAWSLDGEMFSGVKWVFQASGPGYARLRRIAGDRPEVEWGGSLPDDEWHGAMRRAHLALVTMAPGAERVVMPSKTYSALAAGQAILAICPRRSDLAELVELHDCGWVVEPGDVRGLREVISSLQCRPGELEAKRRRAYAAGHEHYDMRPIAARWLELIDEVVGGPRPAMASLLPNEAIV